MEKTLSKPMLSERQLRLAICEIGAEMYKRRYIVAADGNLSVKLNNDSMLITPSGVCKGRMRPDDLLVATLDGTRKRGSGTLSSEWKMHHAVYRLKPEINAIVHGHPLYATSFAAAGIALDEPVLPEIITTLGHVPLAKYATPGSTQLGENIADAMRVSNAALLENHGLVAAGSELWQAYFHFERVEHAAQILYQAKMLGGANPLKIEQVRKLKSND